MRDVNKVVAQILEIDSSNGFVTEDKVVELCLMEHLPDTVLPRLYDRLSQKDVLVLDIPDYIENKYVIRYLKEHKELFRDESVAEIVAAIMTYIGLVSHSEFERLAEAKEWLGLKKKLAAFRDNRTMSNKEWALVDKFLEYNNWLDLGEQNSGKEEEAIFNYLSSNAGFIYSANLISKHTGIDIGLVEKILEKCSWVMRKGRHFYVPKSYCNKTLEQVKNGTEIRNKNASTKTDDANESSEKQTTLDCIRKMDECQLATLLKAVATEGLDFFSENIKVSNDGNEINQIIRWLEADSKNIDNIAIKQENVIDYDILDEKTIDERKESFIEWLKADGFLDIVIESYLACIDEAMIMSGICLLAITNEEGVKKFLEIRKGLSSPTERTLCKYYIQYLRSNTPVR